jgi:hypothetical protein
MSSARSKNAGASACATPVNDLPSEIQCVVARYVQAHAEPTRARVEAAFSPHLRVYGNSLPPEGLDREGYLELLQKKYHGTVFAQAANTRPFLTMDKTRVVFRWTLSAGAQRIAAGLDYLTVANGLISKIVGLC